MKKKLIVVVKEFGQVVFKDEEWNKITAIEESYIVSKNNETVFVAPRENVIFYRTVEEKDNERI